MQSGRWTDIVFENRNREYGAYIVRNGYPKSLFTATIVAVAVTLLLLFTPRIIRLISPPAVAVATKPQVTLVDLGAPPAIDKRRPPQPQIALPPAKKKVFKFTPPVLTDKQIQEELPDQRDLAKKQTGAEDEEGVDSQVTGSEDGMTGEGEDAVYTIVDKAAEFPGGPVIMARFVAKNLRYPQEARRARLEGVVHVGFIVGKTGLITDIEIVKGLSAECDAEAMTVVRMMPRWKPAYQNGVPVRSKLVLPLRFALGIVR